MSSRRFPGRPSRIRRLRPRRIPGRAHDHLQSSTTGHPEAAPPAPNEEGTIASPRDGLGGGAARLCPAVPAGLLARDLEGARPARGAPRGTGEESRMIESQGITVDLSKLYDPRRNEKQLLFHRAPETYKLFGGAMGGGKTAALINEGIALGFDYPGNFGLLMRKTWPSFRHTVLPQLEHFLDRRLVRDWNRAERVLISWNGSVAPARAR